MSMRHLLVQVNAHHTPITITLPDGSNMTSTASGFITLGKLPRAALSTHIFPKLTAALLGTPQLCDHGLSVIYTKTHLTIVSPRNDILLRQPRTESLWTVPTTPPPTPQILIPAPSSPKPIVQSAMTAYPIEPTDHARCLFYQRVFCSPVKSTFITATSIPGFTDMFPDLTRTFIRKNYVHTAATAMGHLNRTRKNLRSTQQQPKPPHTPSSPPVPSHQDSEVYLRVYKPTLTNYSDATGTVLKSNLHFLIMYHFDTNYIHAVPLFDYTSASYHKAYLAGMNMYATSNPGSVPIPVTEITDNAANQTFIADLKKRGITCQLVPPSLSSRKQR